MEEDVVQGKDEPMSKDLFMLVRRCPRKKRRGEGEMGRWGNGFNYFATGNLFTEIQTTTEISTTFEELGTAKSHHILNPTPDLPPPGHYELQLQMQMQSGDGMRKSSGSRFIVLL